MLLRDGREGGEVRGVAGEMHGHDGAGLRRDGAAHGGGIEVVGARIEIGEHRHALLVEDADDGAHVGDGRDNDLVTGAQVERGDGDVEGGGAGRAGEDVLERVEFAEFLDERGGLRPLPVEERRLVHHGGEPGQLGGTPALRLGRRLIDDRLGGGGGDGAHERSLQEGTENGRSEYCPRNTRNRSGIGLLSVCSGCSVGHQFSHRRAGIRRGRSSRGTRPRGRRGSGGCSSNGSGAGSGRGCARRR